MTIARKRKLDSQLSRFHYLLAERETITLSIHQLLVNYLQKSVTSSADDFLTFCSANMPLNICSAAKQSTRSQSNNHAWSELRYGRITASKCFQASTCQTANGSLVNEVIGISKMFSTEAMSRGKNLEKIFANKLKIVEKINFSDCGIFLMPEYTCKHFLSFFPLYFYRKFFFVQFLFSCKFSLEQFYSFTCRIHLYRFLRQCISAIHEYF